MRYKRTVAAVAIALSVAGCGGGGGDNDTVPPSGDTPITPFNNVVDKAGNVADAVDQRTADLQDQVTP